MLDNRSEDEVEDSKRRGALLECSVQNVARYKSNGTCVSLLTNSKDQRTGVQPSLQMVRVKMVGSGGGDPELDAVSLTQM